jgi:hypothetical protein
VVATASGDFSWGEPGGSPTVIARLNDGSNHPCLYAYETNAPAGRHDLTATATDNEDATGASAAVSLTVRAWLQSSTQEGGQIHLQWVGGGTLQSATNVPGPWSDVSGVASPFLADTTNPVQFFRVKQ